MTAVGELGRTPPGESWRRAMGDIAELYAKGSKKRYQVRGREIEPGWWAYDVTQAPGRIPEPPVEPMTKERITELIRALPRCAQRARASHGGDSKVAWPSALLASQAAELLGGSAYHCKLPAPAIGDHWHTTAKRKQRRYR